MIQPRDLRVNGTIYTSSSGLRREYKIIEIGKNSVTCVYNDPVKSDKPITFYFQDNLWNFFALNQKDADKLYIAYLDTQIERLVQLKNEFIKNV